MRENDLQLLVYARLEHIPDEQSTARSVANVSPMVKLVCMVCVCGGGGGGGGHKGQVGAEKSRTWGGV
jgi:hypothetical protein